MSWCCYGNVYCRCRYAINVCTHFDWRSKFGEAVCWASAATFPQHFAVEAGTRSPDRTTPSVVDSNPFFLEGRDERLLRPGAVRDLEQQWSMSSAVCAMAERFDRRTVQDWVQSVEEARRSCIPEPSEVRDINVWLRTEKSQIGMPPVALRATGKVFLVYLGWQDFEVELKYTLQKPCKNLATSKVKNLTLQLAWFSEWPSASSSGNFRD